MATTSGTPFASIDALVRQLAARSKRLEKRRLIAEFLHSLNRDEVSSAVLLIVGRIFPEADSKALKVGWATLQKALGATRQARLDARPLTILDVRRAFEEIAAASGPDSVRVRQRLLQSLLGQATREEQEILLKNIFGEMRIGVNEGVMLEAIADAAKVDVETVRTAHMFLGDLGKVAEVALFNGAEGLASFELRLLSPVKPMMAEIAEDLDDVLEEHGGTTAAEYKFDGARIQIHRDGDRVKVFSRRLSDVTKSLPEVVEIARSLRASSCVLEGEVVAIDERGRPRPFQELMRRFRRVHDIDALRREIPLRLHLFDLLHVDGRTLINAPYRERWAALERLAPAEVLAERIVTSSRAEIEAFLKEAIEAGHEGLMAKQLDSTYTVGKRGKKWFKIKRADTLDCAIIAAEWGHGRREGWLSNYWLAVRDEAAGAFQMIGKTFKGLTDKEFDRMTQRLLELKEREEPWVVHVRPEVVVEVAYNEVQRSPHYPSGFALRFARVTRIRDDKGPNDVNTYDRLKQLYAKQFERKGAAFEAI
ncbi:MAG TPA: ATP-dependent DNA ligase [Thermoplasmata archaeon]|nr:ATP-dependent DNA ligase [Thermoplasmata archaeon]